MLQIKTKKKNDNKDNLIDNKSIKQYLFVKIKSTWFRNEHKDKDITKKILMKSISLPGLPSLSKSPCLAAHSPQKSFAEEPVFPSSIS